MINKPIHHWRNTLEPMTTAECLLLLFLDATILVSSLYLEETAELYHTASHDFGVNCSMPVNE